MKAFAVVALALIGNAAAWEETRDALIRMAKRQTGGSSGSGTGGLNIPNLNCDSLPANTGNAQQDGSTDLACSLLQVSQGLTSNANCVTGQCSSFTSALTSCATSTSIDALLSCACTSDAYQAVQSCASCVNASSAPQNFATGCSKLGKSIDGSSTGGSSSASSGSSSATDSSTSAASSAASTTAAAASSTSSAGGVASIASSATSAAAGAASSAASKPNDANAIKAGTGALAVVLGAFAALA